MGVAPRALVLNSNFPTKGRMDRKLYAHINTNIGNAYISYSCIKLFGLDRDATLLNDNIGLPEDWPGRLAEQAADVELILLNLQDQLREDFADSWYDNGLVLLRSLEKIKAPLTAFSLSANSFGGRDLQLPSKLSESKISFFKYLSERATSIGVRGEYSAYVLDRLGVKNFAIVGCPSYFEAGPHRRVKHVEASELTSKCLGLTGHLRLTQNENQLLYFLQGDSDWPMVELLYMPGGKRPKLSTEQRTWLFNPVFEPVIRAVPEDRVHFFTNFSQWKSTIASQCMAVAGTRLHGAILALNAGVPAIVTNADSRAQESCEFLGIPWIPEGFLADSTFADIYEHCDVDLINERYGALYTNFATWAGGNGLVVCESERGGFDPPPLQKAPLTVRVERAMNVLSTKAQEASSLLQAREAEVAQAMSQIVLLTAELDRTRLESAATAARLATTDAELAAILMGVAQARDVASLTQAELDRTRAEAAELSGRLGALEAELAAARAEAAKAIDAVASMAGERDRLRAEADRLAQEAETMKAKGEESAREIEELQRQLLAAEAKLGEAEQVARGFELRLIRIGQSQSWRMTAPYRAIGRYMRRLRRPNATE